MFIMNVVFFDINTKYIYIHKINLYYLLVRTFIECDLSFGNFNTSYLILY